MLFLKFLSETIEYNATHKRVDPASKSVSYEKNL